ncbi:glutamate--tRNA ligase [Candidatus Magnetomonas plexicatena]|uniref:glutamate--tRNA ligase n=1 Tax=Candidatus Magnetomonas plexicatena TaxID=2552947 RepID=UPI001C793D66|nr:glutamate--tRNA ligase [Nitrospirales bacterium LBB_01]
MSKEVRVRFAPSPTGYLHIGGARTALFNYLFARKHKGTFILRIEDTDRSRSTDEFIDAIIDGMKWLNLSHDEGPFRQTDRTDIYNKYAIDMLENGAAYYCYCEPDELEMRRKEALKHGKPPKYDGRCRDIKTPPIGIKPTIRFKMPEHGQTIVDDLIKGKVDFDNSVLDDFIIMRSDGSPTYNFVVVCDDIDMGITHIIRGDDHLNNTPKQMQIYKAFGKMPPLFAHLPMILGSDKTRLSKRHGATSVMAYKDMGYLPEALLNYLVRLGWSFGDQEVFSVDELTEKFSLESVGKSSAVFNPEKLLWLNSEYIKNSDLARLASFVKPFLLSMNIVDNSYVFDEGWLASAIATLLERSRTLIELANSLRYYIADTVEIDEKAGKKFITQDTKPFLTAVADKLKNLEDFTPKEIEGVFLSLMSEHNVALGKIAQPVRVAITGNTVSPGIYEVLEIVGKEKSLRRLNRAIES